MRGKQILEETYDIRLSNKGKYYTQLASLDQSGVLANKTKINEVLFRLVEEFDLLIQEVEDLKEKLKNVSTTHRA